MATLLLIFVLIGASRPRQPLIGTIHDTAPTERCGCTFLLRKQHLRDLRSSRIVFFSECNGRPALLNVSGQDQWLDLTTPDVDDDWGGEPGYRSVVIYKKHDVTARIVRTVSYACPPKDECEYVEMKVTITVTQGSRHQTIRASGTCGC